MKKLIISYILHGKEFPIMGVVGDDFAIVDIIGKRITKVINKGFKLIHTDNNSMIYASNDVYTQYKFTVIA